MKDFIVFMAAPMVACLFLTGIHGYLGIHVISRGVIFVDLAMAQIAGLGAAVGVLFGLEVASHPSYVISLGATTLGAFVLSAFHFRKSKVPQEAIIGVVYAVAAAAVILVMDRSPHGDEHIKQLLVGHLLWINWREVAMEGVAYSLIGFMYFLARKKIHLVSLNPQAASAQGLKIFWWDLLFYGLFGFVVTISVQIAGVLLVFAYLIVPAIIGTFFAQSFGRRLLTGWSIGLVVSLIGCTLSYALDLPTGATIVVTFGLVLILAGLVYRLVPSAATSSA
jgi:zinc/manganese transport system permease protein